MQNREGQAPGCKDPGPDLNLGFSHRARGYTEPLPRGPGATRALTKRRWPPRSLARGTDLSVGEKEEKGALLRRSSFELGSPGRETRGATTRMDRWL